MIRLEKIDGKWTATKKAEAIKATGKSYLDSVSVHITTGNGKTGIDSINLLPGNKAFEYSGAKTPELFSALQAVTGFDGCGTCSGTCPGCYALKMTRFPDVLINLFENTLLAKRDPRSFWLAVEQAIYGDGNAPELFRIHDSGDFFSYEYFVECMEMIRRHPETRYGAYTKESAIVVKYGIDNLPDNLSLQCSPWPGYCDPIGDLPQFCYDDGSNPELAGLPHCPAVDKNGNRTGIQCKQCKYCYYCRRGQKRAVYAH